MLQLQSETELPQWQQWVGYNVAESHMNVIVTNQPLNSERSSNALGGWRLMRRRCLALLTGYSVYLLLLGPYWALDGRAVLDFVPRNLREVAYWPSAPIWMIPHVRGRFADYLDCWYLDPNAADQPTGWD